MPFRVTGMHEHASRKGQLLDMLQRYTLLTLLLVVVALIVYLLLFDSTRTPFSSSETRFTESSTHGLNIMPASCASFDGYYHALLHFSGDQLGFASNSGETEYGAYVAYLTKFICVTNNTGKIYYVPAKTAAELQAFKDLGTSVPSLSVY